MNARPCFSVVTIVRNDLPGLQATQGSLQAQSELDHEWIVVDGLSTDGTRAYALSLIEEGQAHGRVRGVSEKDKGIFDAMNKGLRLATGRYVVFMNAGDVFDGADVLAQVKAALNAQGWPDMLYGDSREHHPTLGMVYKAAKGHQRVHYGMFACHQSVYYRTEPAQALAYDTGFKVSGDYDFTSRFLKQARSVHRLDASLCIFDVSGISNSNKVQGRNENWRVQQATLGLSLPQRLWIRAQYVASALVAENLPGVYKLLRYKKPVRPGA
jgi:putative colanic acid biosynthesis glycosyltransferase